MLKNILIVAIFLITTPLYSAAVDLSDIDEKLPPVLCNRVQAVPIAVLLSKEWTNAARSPVAEENVELGSLLFRIGNDRHEINLYGQKGRDLLSTCISIAHGPCTTFSINGLIQRNNNSATIREIYGLLCGDIAKSV